MFAQTLTDAGCFADVDVVVAPEDVVVAPKAGASKKARRKLELEQKSMLKSKGLIVKKAKCAPSSGYYDVHFASGVLFA